MADPIKVIKNVLEAEGALADFISGPDRDGLPGWVQSGYRTRCRQFANLPGWARALSGKAGGSINRVCDPYLGDNGWDGPELDPPPFEGGQCAVTYNFQWQQRQFSGGAWGWSSTSGFSIVGPVSIQKASDRAPFVCPTPPATFDCNAGAFDGAGVRRQILANGCTDDPQGWRLISLTRSDGQPDDCGSLPPTLRPGPNPPPDPGPLPGPEPTDNPDPDNPIPIIPIPPFNDPVFGPQPITGPDGDGGGGGGGGGGGNPPGDVGEPGQPEESDGNNNASGCAPAGSVLSALKIDFVEIPPKARQFAEGVYRGVCYAYLGTLEGLDLDPAGASMRSGQFIFAEKDYLTCWEVRANTGWRLSVTPYYRAVEE